MTNRDNLKVLVRGAYDVQKLRIQMGNRIVANFKAKLGQKPSESEETIDEEGQDLLKMIRASYEKITQGSITLLKKAKFTGDEVISNFTEYCLIEQYISLETQEYNHFKRLGKVLEDFEIYTKFLKDVKGCGPAMAGVIISEIDITKAEYPSSLWKYAGLDVARMEVDPAKYSGTFEKDATDGKHYAMAGRSRKEGHLVMAKYTNKAGEEAERKSITFNPFLKTKLTGVLGISFLRSKSPYRDIYDNYKHRLETSPQHADKTKVHRHNMAIRYMVKMFLALLYAEWRKLEGLPVAVTYSEAKFKVHKKAA